MALMVCNDCGTLFAVGLAACPQCRGTDARGDHDPAPSSFPSAGPGAGPEAAVLSVPPPAPAVHDEAPGQQ